MSKKDFTKDFENNGYVLLKNIFTKQDTNKILDLIDIYIKKHKSKFEIYEINYTKNNKINSVHCLEKYDSSIIDFVKKNSKLMEIINNLLGEKEVEIKVSEAFLKPAGEGMESPIHQDNNLWCLKKGDAFTAWIALDEIDENNGGLKIFKESHKLGNLEHEESFAPGTSQTVMKKEYPKFGGANNYIINKLNPGDIQFHHSLTIHGSNPNITNRSRRVMTLQVFSKEDERNPILWKKYRDSVLKQQLLKNGITQSLMENNISCENVYKFIDDPWNQKSKQNIEKFELIAYFVSYLNTFKNCSNLLELGSGLGQISNYINNKNLNINITGSDISETCVKKAIKNYPKIDFLQINICNKKDREIIVEKNPDILLLSDITWYILNDLDEIKFFLKTNCKGKFIIHFLNIYDNQKYGLDKFKNHDEILKYFQFDYIYEGILYIGNSKLSYFLAKI
jgi:phytanoyl-CoA hydroxylase